MAARIVHFGVDESFRLAILSRAGFKVEDCDSSLSRLATTLRKHRRVNAVVLSECDGQEGSAIEALTLARSECKAPVILFRSASPRSNHTDVDLVIPNLTEPGVWLQAIYAVIARSQRLTEESHAIRHTSRKLVQESADARLKSVATRKRTAYLRDRADKNFKQGSVKAKKAGD